MSRTRRRQIVWLTLVASAVILLSYTAVLAQKKPPQPPIPVPGDADEPVNNSDTMTLPTDREAKGIIAAVKDYISKKDWDVAARSLQYLLEKQEDSFFLVHRQTPEGKSYDTRISIRIEANRMIGELPPEGMEVYRQKFGARAKQMLEEGIEKRDPQMLALVAMRYRHTESGVQAVQRLADYYLDRGNYQSACGQFSQLIELLDKEKPEVKKELAPKVYFKAALAFQRLGNSKDADTAKRLWKQVEEMVGDNGLTFGKVTYTVPQLKEEFDRVAQASAHIVAHQNVYRGDASRTAQGVGGEPFLDPRVQISMTNPRSNEEGFDKSKTFGDLARNIADKVTAAMKAINTQKRAIMPGFFPIAAQNRIIFRTYDGVYSYYIHDDPTRGSSQHGLDKGGAKAGDLDWMTDADGSLHALMEPGKKATVEGWWPNYRQMFGISPNVMSELSIYIENAQIGSLSHDGQSIYFVDDLAVPPPPPMLQNAGFGGQMPMGDAALTDQIFCNKLKAIELDTGRFLWQLGGRKSANVGRAPDNLVPNNRFGGGIMIAPNGRPVPVEPKKEEAPPKPFVPPPLANPNAPVFINAFDELLDSYFLGPPLPLNGKLYVLVEVQGEIQLICLDPKKTQKSKINPAEESPELVWRQPLGSAPNKLSLDAMRRMQPCHLSYSDGLLICPTNAGAVIAVDVFTQSLAWAFSYKSTGAPNSTDMDMNMNLRRGGIRRMDMGMQPMNLSQDHWYTSAPAIVNGRVVFTAQDYSSLECLSLKDGAKLWDSPVPRAKNDLFFAGVFNGKAIVVGRDEVRALDVFNNAKPVWAKKIGIPSGQGVASNGWYYLPLKQGLNPDDPPEVCAINVDTGEMHHTKSRKNLIPGNLIFHDGDVLSQGLWEVSAFPQLQLKKAEMKRRLEKDPHDPFGLFELGELHLDGGELVPAVEAFKTSLENKPRAEVRVKVRSKLYEALKELLQRDFVKSESYLKLFEDLCTNDVDLAEKDIRKSTYLCILAEGREKQGRLLEAFDAYLNYGQINANREMVPSVDDPGVLADPVVWARGRIKAMMEKATPAERQPLEERLAGEWKTIHATGDIEKIRGFVKLFGSAVAAGRQARLNLAERLIAAGQDKDLLEAQIHLNELKAITDDPEMAGKAVDGLARLMIRMGEMQSAIHFFRDLNEKYSNIKIRDGKTGSEIYNEVITEKRFLPYLESAHPAWNKQLRGDVTYAGANPMFTQVAHLQLEGDPLPFVQKFRLILDSANGNNSWQLRFVDQKPAADSPVIHDLMIGQLGYGGAVSNTTGIRMAQIQGNILMLNVQTKVLAYEIHPTGKPTKLWEYDVAQLPVGAMQMGPPVTDAAGVTWITYPDGTRARWGFSMLMGASYVCLSTSDGLVALDFQKNKLWKREAPANLTLFGDSDYVIAVETNDTGAPSRVIAVRAADGVKVDIADCRELLTASKKLRTFGRYILAFEDGTKGNLLRMYDPISGKDVWQQAFAEGAVGLRPLNTDLVGAIEPDGTMTLFNPQMQKIVLRAKTGLCLTDLVGHLNGVKEAYLLADANRYYVVLNKTAENGVQTQSGFGPTFRSVRMHGAFYAFEKGTGEVEWYVEMANQFLMLDQFAELPAVFWASWTQRVGPNGAGTNGSRLEAYSKRTGETLLEPKQQNLNNASPFYAMNIDPAASTVELVRQDVRLKILPKDAPPSGNGPGGSGPPPPGVPRQIRGAIPFQPVPAIIRAVPVQAPQPPVAK